MTIREEMADVMVYENDKYLILHRQGDVHVTLYDISEGITNAEVISGVYASDVLLPREIRVALDVLELCFTNTPRELAAVMLINPRDFDGLWARYKRVPLFLLERHINAIKSWAYYMDVDAEPIIKWCIREEAGIYSNGDCVAVVDGKFHFSSHEDVTSYERSGGMWVYDYYKNIMLGIG